MSTTHHNHVQKTVQIMPIASYVDDSGSYDGSLFGMDSFRTRCTTVLPEQWTLPKEWNIELRELYENWKMDVQTQISVLNKQLYASLQAYPDEEIGPYINVDNKFEEARLHIATDEIRGRMGAGVRRN